MFPYRNNKISYLKLIVRILRYICFDLWENTSLIKQKYQSFWGPLAYLNPEDDARLKTINYLCVLNNDLSVKESYKVDTKYFDKTPIWEFVGLEDARVVRWDDKLYYCGVRRDTKTNGEGRMELSEIEITNNSAKEIRRSRINNSRYPK